MSNSIWTSSLSSLLPETLQSEYLSVRYPESLHHLQLHRNPVSRVVAQLRKVVVDGLRVNLNIILLSDEIHLFELWSPCGGGEIKHSFILRGRYNWIMVCIDLSNSTMHGHQVKRTNHLPPPTTTTHLNSLIPPFHNKVGINFYCELSVINFEYFKIIKSNLNFCWRLPRGIERRVEFAVVSRNTKHVIYRAVTSLQLVVAWDAWNKTTLIINYSDSDWGIN